MGREPALRPRSPSRLLRRLFALTAGISLLLGANASSALAHAAFLDSTPEPGKRLKAGPREVTLRFTEPLNQALSKATLVDVATGKRVSSGKLPARNDQELALRPAGQLPRAPYRVEWHTVSTVDGHPLEGSFSFGVRTAAAGGEHEVEQSPLARDGWVRIAFRALFYAALFFFAGGLLNSALLSRKEPAGWLVPQEVRDQLSRAGQDGEAFAARAWARTLDIGWLAAGAAAAIALVEAADAGGSLSLSNVNDYLLTNAAGLARVGTVVALAMAAMQARRMRLAASFWMLVALIAIALGGHANSAEPRAGAVFTDWTHLIAASVWVGGIAQIVFTWLRKMRRADRTLRLTVMRAVLDRFGKVALPAFFVVAVSGLVNALIELGHAQALWQTPYGRVLLAKVAAVGLIAGASYWHALRLRPRLLSANPHFPERLEGRHWRLLSSEPVLAVAVVAAAAALVAFPLPPRQLGATDEARAAPACNSCPLPKAQSGELPVAGHAGSRIAAFWLRREGDRLSGSVRLLDSNAKPVDAPVRLLGGGLKPCGLGCWRLAAPRAGDVITLTVTEKGKQYRATVPARWREGVNTKARRLVERAQDTMRALSTLQEQESLTSGPGTFVHTSYRLVAPDRFTYRTSSGASAIVIGKHEWDRVGSEAWQAGVFGGLTPFRTRGFFRWTPYARSARFLGVRRVKGRRVAEVALMDQATPIWFRLTIDLKTGRVLRDRMITNAHFMSRRYFAFNEPLRIEAPAHSIRAP